MKLLFLFFTQAEAGAPGYLSRRGEESALNLAESLSAFLTQSLGLALDDTLHVRARSLEEDVRWRLYRKPEALKDAIAASLGLHHDVLLLCGAKERTLNTAQAVASRLGLPVCVDARADTSSEDKPRPGGLLSDTLASLTEEGWLEHGPGVAPPKAVIVGTSREALEEWISLHFAPEKLRSFKDVMGRSTEEGVSPTVFACGYQDAGAGTGGEWLFD